MTTPRDRLMALADATPLDLLRADDRDRALALAAYKMAIEDAAKVCEDAAAKLYDHAKGPYLRSAAAVRALADSLD